MYDNIGKKVKGLAIGLFIVETIAAIIVGFALLSDTENEIFWLIIVCGPIVAWISSWILYAFGELVDRICNIEVNTRKEVYTTTTPNQTIPFTRTPYIRKSNNNSHTIKTRSKNEMLDILQKALDSGMISEEEFNTKKQQILEL